MKHEIKKCATILTNLRDSFHADREEAIFAYEQRAQKIAAEEHIRNHAKAIHVKIG